MSLLELTALCQQVTGNRLSFTAVPATNPLDVRIYVSDNRKVERELGWRATRNISRIVEDIFNWIATQPDTLKSVLSYPGRDT